MILYDLVIVDEAARANPLDLLIPMSMGKQIILVGDHKQLPHMLDPEVVKSFEDNDKMKDLGVLEQSLFERLYRFFDQKDTNVKRTARLSRQYRMNPVIGEFVSENFYTEYPLDSSEVNIESKMPNLGGMYNDKPIAWINLDKNRYGMEEGRQSKSRTKEAKRIVQEVRTILNIDSKKTIGIISFYRRQSELIQNLIDVELNDVQREKVSVGTVDAFQGKEFDVVFLSCVRANTMEMDDMRHRVGHINDMSRLCVSFTRAKQLFRYNNLCNKDEIKKHTVITESVKALELIMNNYIKKTKKNEIVTRYRNTINYISDIRNMMDLFDVQNSAAENAESRRANNKKIIQSQSIMSHFLGKKDGHSIMEKYYFLIVDGYFNQNSHFRKLILEEGTEIIKMLDFQNRMRNTYGAHNDGDKPKYISEEDFKTFQEYFTRTTQILLDYLD